MNAGILAQRTAQAIADITAETERLGGALVVPSSRGDAATRQCLVLEAVAAALRAIDGSAGATEPDSSQPPAAPRPKTKEATSQKGGL